MLAFLEISHGSFTNRGISYLGIPVDAVLNFSVFINFFLSDQMVVLDQGYPVVGSLINYYPCDFGGSLEILVI